MNSVIEYYYDIFNIKTICLNDKYIFENNGNTYLFYRVFRDAGEISLISKLLLETNYIFNIVLNKLKMEVTNVNNDLYVLVKVNSKLTLNNLIKKRSISNTFKYSSLIKNNWYDMWIKKIDNITYEMVHIKGKYLFLEQYFDYFIGLSETAISYYNDTMLKYGNSLKNDLVLSYKRINFNDKYCFFDINNLVIDHYVRDISEYFKYLFFYGDFSYNTVFSVLNFLKLSTAEYQLLFCRLLFPTFFFVLYDLVINNKEKETKLYLIINKMNDYEVFLKKIYNYMSRKNKITKIEWLS